jgi:hypothetical protein
MGEHLQLLAALLNGWQLYFLLVLLGHQLMKRLYFSVLLQIGFKLFG